MNRFQCFNLFLKIVCGENCCQQVLWFIHRNNVLLFMIWVT